MMPTIPDPMTIDLGSRTLSFGWTMDGSVLLVLALLIVPWLLVGVAALAELLDPRMGATEAPPLASTAAAAATSPPVAMPLPQAA